MTPKQLRHILADALEGAAERLREGLGSDAEPQVNDAVPAAQGPLPEALKEMKSRWKHPISGMGWYKQAKRDFAALLED